MNRMGIVQFNQYVLPANATGSTAQWMGTFTPQPLAPPLSITMHHPHNHIWMNVTVGWNSPSLRKTDLIFEIHRNTIGNVVFRAFDSIECSGVFFSLPSLRTTSFSHVDWSPTTSPENQQASYIVTARLAFGSSGGAFITGPITIAIAEIGSVSINRQITLMTRNIYIGASLIPLFTATPQQLPQTVHEVFEQIPATRFPERAEALADEIAGTQPDLIGLQEVALVRIQSPGDSFSGNAPATTVVFDYLEILLDKLNQRGLDYEAVAVTTNFDGEFPSSTGDEIRLTDRDVILARKKSNLEISNIQERNFNTTLVLPVAGRPFALLRGWASVDVNAGGYKFRLINTHLEASSSPVQAAQADELLQGPGNTELPLLFIGDFNSNADGSGSPTYGRLIAAGFKDVWKIAGSGPGFTSYHDVDLRNPVPNLKRRIDFILFRHGFTVEKVSLVGGAPADRTPSGLWPSDHAGVVAVLKTAD